MTLDIRLPIGMMFTLIGLMLGINGLMVNSNPATYQCALGININLIWGGVLLAFGLLMLGFALFDRGTTEAEESKAQSKEAALK